MVGLNDTQFLISNLLENLKVVCEKPNDEINKFQSNFIKLNIVKYVYPIILVFGIVGNILSFIVMLRVYKRKKSSYRFALNLAALSLADLAVLIFGCFREYSDDILEWRMRSMNMFMCKFIYFNCYLFSCFSAYLHTLISIERWKAISNPINSKINPLKNKALISITFLFCVVVSSPYIYFAQIKSSVAINETNQIQLNIVNECEATQDYYSSDLILVISDSIFYCIIPFLLSFIFSIISLALLCSKNKPKKKEVELLRIMSIDEASNLDHKEQRNPSSNIKLTVMLMSIPISYLVTALPIFIIILLQFFLIGNRTFNENEAELTIAKMLMYINCSINILFYIFLGKSLRKDFLEILPIGILSHS